MKKKNFLMLPCIAAVAIATFVGKKTFESHAFESNDLLAHDVEALAKCEAFAEAKDQLFNATVATAYLECDGQGTCTIPSNAFGLTASCSGKQIVYKLTLFGKEVN